MSVVKLSDLFDIEYGTQLDFNDMCIDDQTGINFVSRSRENLGITEHKVMKIDGIEALDKGTISVSLGGTYLLSSFVQPEVYYTGQNVKVLTPKEEMNFNTKIFYTLCISNNRFKYSSHGREANKTLDFLLVPDLDSIPNWVHNINFDDYKISDNKVIDVIHQFPSVKNWGKFYYDELFIIKKGVQINQEHLVDGCTPFISAIEGNNGVRQYVDSTPLFEGNTITINSNGSVGEAFYQKDPYIASADVNILYPKFKLNKYIGIFMTTVFRIERYKYNFGRKWGLERMKKDIIKLPITNNGKPDFEFMENYIKSLPYSASL